MVAVLDSFFSFWGQKRWSLLALDRWSSYTVMIVWELAWADSALVVLLILLSGFSFVLGTLFF